MMSSVIVESQRKKNGKIENIQPLEGSRIMASIEATIINVIENEGVSFEDAVQFVREEMDYLIDRAELIARKKIRSRIR